MQTTSGSRPTYRLSHVQPIQTLTAHHSAPSPAYPRHSRDLRQVRGKLFPSPPFRGRGRGEGETWNVKDFTAFALVFLFIITAVLFLVNGCATTSVSKKKAPVTVSEILQMSKDKVPPDEIIKKMRESGTVYRLEASQLAKLEEEGVSSKVINYMQKTYIDAVRRNQYLKDWSYWTMGPDQYWYGGGPFGWPDEYLLGP